VSDPGTTVGWPGYGRCDEKSHISHAYAMLEEVQMGAALYMLVRFCPKNAGLIGNNQGVKGFCLL
jgi:hypothetical protein